MANFIQISSGLGIIAGLSWRYLLTPLLSFSSKLKQEKIQKLRKELLEFRLFADQHESMIVAFSYESSVMIIALMKYMITFAVINLLSVFPLSIFGSNLVISALSGVFLFIVSVRFSSRVQRFSRWQRALLDPSAEVELIEQELSRITDE